MRTLHVRRWTNVRGRGGVQAAGFPEGNLQVCISGLDIPWVQVVKRRPSNCVCPQCLAAWCGDVSRRFVSCAGVAVTPGFVFVVERAATKAAVEDADEAV